MLYFFGAALAVLVLGLIWMVLRYRRQAEELRREGAKNAQLQNLLRIWQSRAQEMQACLQTMQEIRHDLRHYLRMSEEQNRPHGAEMADNLRAVRDLLNRNPVQNADMGPVSVLAEYYRKAAECLGVETDIKLDLDARWDGDAMTLDLCLVVGNLLENAVEALAKEGGGWLRVRSTVTSGWISLVVGNSSAACLRIRNGRYLSGKSPGRFGIGLDTVRRIALQYGGKAEFCADGSEFKASVFLPLTPARFAGEEAEFPA